MTDTMTRSTDEGSCSCGCGDPSKAGADTQEGGCSCGCGTAAGSTASTPRTVAEEVAHLTSLRQSIDRRLSELKS